MSKELENFKKSYKNFAQHNLDLAMELSKTHPNLVLLINNGPCDFSKSPWVSLDNKTLAEFKALALYTKVAKDLLPVIYSPSLNPQRLSEATDSIKEIAENTLNETLNNRNGTEIVLDFLKSCVNFLITIVTFGQKPNFFKSSTFELEKIIQVQQDLHNICDKLSEEEKITELDRTSINFRNGFAMIN